jgi:hypothetical protein
VGHDLYPESLLPPPMDAQTEVALLRRALVVKRTTLYLVSLVLLVLVVSMSYVGIQTARTVQLMRETQQSNTPIAADTHSLIRSFKDCVRPGGKCYGRGVRRTVHALGNVDAANRRVSAAGAGCSIGIPVAWSYDRRYRYIHQCIAATLDSVGHSQ